MCEPDFIYWVTCTDKAGLVGVTNYQIYTCQIAHPIQNHCSNRMEYAQSYRKVNILIRSFTNSITLMPQPLPSVLLWCSSFLQNILTHVVIPEETEADSLNLMQLPYITTMYKASFYTHIEMLENCVSVSLNLLNYCLNISQQASNRNTVYYMYGFRLAF